MAKKDKKQEKKIVLERTYNVPLRKEFSKVPRSKRSKKASTALKEFLIRHMKSDKIKIGRHANMKLWQDGIRNPPHHIKVVAKKDEEGNVFAELEGAPVDVIVEPPKKKKEPAKEKVTEDKIEEEFKKLEEKTEKIKEQKQEQAKDIEKEEIKELKKEQPKTPAPKDAAQEKKVESHPNAPKGKSELSKP